jgi:hypothetical protein
MKWQFLIILIHISCTSSSEQMDYKNMYELAISNGQCSIAQQTIPLEQNQREKFALIESSGAYVITVGASAVTSIFDLLIMGRCQYGMCNDEESSALKALFPATYKLWEVSDDHRCPNNSYYINKFIDTAECYLNRGTEKGQQSGHLLIKNLYESSHKPFNCISLKDKKRIERVYSSSTI